MMWSYDFTKVDKKAFVKRFICILVKKYLTLWNYTVYSSLAPRAYYTLKIHCLSNQEWQVQNLILKNIEWLKVIWKVEAFGGICRRNMEFPPLGGVMMFHSISGRWRDKFYLNLGIF